MNPDLSLKTPLSLVVLVIMVSTGLSQTPVGPLEDSSLTRIVDYLTDNEYDYENYEVDYSDLLPRFNDILVNTLGALDLFKYHYLYGYVHYVAALSAAEADETEDSIERIQAAKNQFQLAYDNYADSIQLPRHRLFARFMVAWCDLRHYLLMDVAETTQLERVLAELDTLEQELEGERDFFEDDLNFLRGYVNYLIAHQRFYDHEDISDYLENARTAFVSVNDTNLTELTRYYLSLVTYLRMQHAILTCDTVDWAVDSLGLINTHFLELNGLAAERFQAAISNSERTRTRALRDSSLLNYNMSMLQLKALRKEAVDADDDLLDFGVGTGVHALVNTVYPAFINNMSVGSGDVVPNVNPISWESDFWLKLSHFLNRVADYQEQGGNTPVFDFDLPSASSPRKKRVRDQVVFYTYMAAIFSGPSNGLPDVSSNIRLTGPCGQPECYVWPWNTQLNRLQLAQAFIENNQNNVNIRWLADYLRSIGRYRPALDIYSQQSSEEARLLSTICRFQLRQFPNCDDVRERLNPDSFAIERLRNEAYYLLGTLCFDLGAPEDDVRTIFNGIDEVDPRAAWWFIDFLGADVQRRLCQIREQLNTVSCWSASAVENLSLDCDDMGSFRSPIIGDLDVRFDLLSHERQEFFRAERQLALRIWQLYSRPLAILYPNRKTGLTGPKEFFLQTNVDVTLAFDSGVAQRRIWIRGPDTTIHRSSNDTAHTEPELLSSTPYEVIVARQGYYPLIKTLVFNRNGQVEKFDLEPAQQVGEGQKVKHGGMLAVSNNISLVNDARSPYFELAPVSNWDSVTSFSGTVQGSFSSLLVQNGAYWLADRSNNRVILWSDKGIQRSIEVGGPPALAVLDNCLYFISSDSLERSKIIRASLDSTLNSTEDTLRVEAVLRSDRFGKLEGIVAVGKNLFFTDWQNSTVYVADRNLREFHELCGVGQARSQDLTAPFRVSYDNDDGLVFVTDLFTSKIFVFHPREEFIQSFNLGDLDGALPYVVQKHDNSLLVYTSTGLYQYALESHPNYTFEPCQTPATQARPDLSKLEASMF